MSKDEHDDMQLDKYLEPNTDEFSNCCNAVIEDTGLCSECLEHCISNKDAHENAMIEREEDRYND